MAKPRKLSRFLCREMLYDYITDELDEVRKASVQDYLKEDDVVRKELEQLNGALDYTNRLSSVAISELLIQRIQEERPTYIKWAERVSWRHWPNFARWGSEALLVSVIAALIAIAIPWERLGEMIPEGDHEVMLAEIRKEDKDSAAKEKAAAAEKIENQINDQVNEDNHPADTLTAAASDENTATMAVVDEEVVAEPQPTDLNQDGGSSGQEVIAENKADLAGNTVEAPPNVEAEAEDESESSAGIAEGQSKKKKEDLQGFVYRAYMYSDQIEVITPKLRDVIEGLGGTKAGQVVLGNRKTKGSYYHFSIPESNYGALIAEFKTFGPVRIYKHPHWRVMPEGKIRFILWVEDTTKN